MENPIMVERYTVFKLLEDSRAEVVYSAPILQEEKVQISPVDQRERQDIAPIYGHKVEQDDFFYKIMESCPDLKTTTRFGVAWKIKKSDGTYRYVRYYRGEYNLMGEYFPMRRNFDSEFYDWIDETQLSITLSRDDFEDKWFNHFTYYPKF